MWSFRAITSNQPSTSFNSRSVKTVFAIAAGHGNLLGFAGFDLDLVEAGQTDFPKTMVQIGVRARQEVPDRGMEPRGY